MCTQIVMSICMYIYICVCIYIYAAYVICVYVFIRAQYRWLCLKAGYPKSMKAMAILSVFISLVLRQRVGKTNHKPPIREW